MPNLQYSNRSFRVVQLLLGVGPTSSPWNDFYSNARKMAPGLVYPPVTVGSLLGRPTLRKAFCMDQVRYYLSCGVIGALLTLFVLARRVRRQGRVLVIHVNAPILGLIAIPIRLLHPALKLVTTQHTDWRHVRRHHKVCFWLLTKISDHYITCGLAVPQTMPVSVRLSLEQSQRISSISNGIDPERLRSYDRVRESPLAGGSGEPKVIAVVAARMVPAKNCRFIPVLVRECPGIAQLIWFGDGPERAQLERQISDLELSDRIDLRGERPRHEVLSALAEATLYISASKWEGLSVADLEAIALGCWPVMSDIIQRHEIANACHIRLYPLSELAAWTNGIADFLRLSCDTRQAMRARLASEAREHFDVRKMVAGYIQIYSNLVSGDPRGSRDG
jgi:glycosyltransferase involved in cell wall biosynthesis